MACAHQCSLIAGGAQQDFNWKGVAMGAVGSAATAGIGVAASGSNGFATALNNTPGVVRATAIGASNSTVSNVVGSVAGLQSFSWKNIAASAVSAGVGYAANRVMGQAQYGTQGWRALDNNSSLATQVYATDPWNTAVRNIGSGIAAGAASAAVRGNLTQSWSGIAQDVIGNTVGNAISNQMAAHSQSKAAGDAYATLRAEGASKEIALAVVTNPGMAAQFEWADTRNTIAQAAGYSNFDALSPDQQINALTGTITFGKPQTQWSADSVFGDTPSMSLLAPESTASRYGRAISDTIVDAQNALGSVIETIGEGNVKWGLRGVQLALGGIPGTAVSLFAEATGFTSWGQGKIQEYVRDPLAGAIGTHIFDASNPNELQAVLPASNLSADFVVGLGSAAIGIVPAKGVQMVVEAAKGGRVASATAQKELQRVRELEVGTYAEQARRSIGDGMTPDHIPSYAAVKANIEAQAGRRLTDEQKKLLREKSTTTVIVDTTAHQKLSATYGGRNTPEQITRDASNLREAATRDFERYRVDLRSKGYSDSQIDATLRAIHDQNVKNGIYK
ncbi:hypothetical protein [Dyella sp.]|uniref:hypothetical protein n=1 Tax=Dyella sp. TaxID=1869338 RepID=UPI002FD98FE2